MEADSEEAKLPLHGPNQWPSEVWGIGVWGAQGNWVASQAQGCWSPGGLRVRRRPCVGLGPAAAGPAPQFHVSSMAAPTVHGTPAVEVATSLDSFPPSFFSSSGAPAQLQEGDPGLLRGRDGADA